LGEEIQEQEQLNEEESASDKKMKRADQLNVVVQYRLSPFTASGETG